MLCGQSVVHLQVLQAGQAAQATDNVLERVAEGGAQGQLQHPEGEA